MSMFDLTQLTDEDLGAALFDALVERFDAKAHEDPAIAVLNRMPTTFAVGRRGNLLTLSQGIGVRLLRGDLKWKERQENRRTFRPGDDSIPAGRHARPHRRHTRRDSRLDRGGVPRTRRTVWQAHCDVATIQRWITDVRLLIEHFSRAHDPSEIAVGTMEQPSASSSDAAATEYAHEIPAERQPVTRHTEILSSRRDLACTP
jgi:hypothetical protein